MNDQEAKSYVGKCLTDYLRMLRESSDVGVARAANVWEGWVRDQSSVYQDFTHIPITLQFSGEVVAVLVDIEMGKWCIDGRVVFCDSGLASDFAHVLKKVSARSVLSDYRQGVVVRAFVGENSFFACAATLSERQILLRRLSSLEAIAWARIEYG